MTAEIFGLLIHILGNYLFVYRWNYGIAGTAISNCLTIALVLSINLWYARSIPSLKRAIACPTKVRKVLNFKGLCSYMEIGLPCAVIRILDGCATHLMTFTTGLLSVKEQAAHIIAVNIAVMFYQFSIGL